jgi:hypothetical protein
MAAGHAKTILIVQKKGMGPQLAEILRMLRPDATVLELTGLGSTIDAVIDGPPILILLGGAIDRQTSAEMCLPFLQRVGYLGPVIVVSSALDLRRSAELLKLGASATIHRDQVDMPSLKALLADLLPQ